MYNKRIFIAPSLVPTGYRSRAGSVSPRNRMARLKFDLYFVDFFFVRWNGGSARAGSTKSRIGISLDFLLVHVIIISCYPT